MALLTAARLKPLPFRFDYDEHVYYVNDQPIPNTTSMLMQTGHIDPRYYTEESRVRGRAVHGLTSQADLQALDVDRLVSPYRGYVLAHAAAMARLKPAFLAIEEPVVHPQFRFGTRPDRVAKVFRALSVLDDKTGGREKWHALQTAIQAIGIGWKYHVPPELIQRFTLYVHENGGFSNQLHTRRRDFDEAYEVIRECCAW
jgi:hypothetical protein